LKNESKGGELLRLDARGRVRTGRGRREMLLAEFDRSGVSGARFVRMAGINYQTFCGWLHVRRRAAVGKPASKGHPKPVKWLEAAVTNAAPPPLAGPLQVELPGGAWMDLASPDQLRAAAQLLRELNAKGGSPC
jgi:hypothetical protein